jgi:outer membrane immunogenic protein
MGAHKGDIMFHKMLFSSIALIGLTGLASAADMYVKAPAPIYVSTWTGCYVGGNAGYGRSVSSHLFSFDDVLNPAAGEYQFTDQFSPKGFLGGFQGGCQLQTGQFLWGLEGDWDSFKHSDSRNWADGTDTASFSSSVSSLWSVRGRFGIITSDVYHLYGTLGFGGARTSYSFNVLDSDTGVNAASFSANPNGIVAGVGAEMKVWNNWVVGLEYLHYAI